MEGLALLKSSFVETTPQSCFCFYSIFPSPLLNMRKAQEKTTSKEKLAHSASLKFYRADQGRGSQGNAVEKKKNGDLLWASLVAQMVKNLPAMWDTHVRSLGQEDPLEKGMATHSSVLACSILWTEEPGGLYIVHGFAKSQTQLSD